MLPEMNQGAAPRDGVARREDDAFQLPARAFKTRNWVFAQGNLVFLEQTFLLR